MKDIIKPSRLLLIAIVALSSGLRETEAQIVGGTTTVAPQTQVTPTRVASLNDYLISRLKATTDDQKSYVREVVKLVDQRKLEKRIVLALERYSRRKSPYFPLPVFERALRVEGAKRGVKVPMIQEIVARNGDNAARAILQNRFQ